MTQRKPNHLKAITGSREPRQVEVDVGPRLEVLPVAPDWLANAHAVAEWNRLGPILVDSRLLTHGGLSAFGMLCSLHGKIVQLYAAGESPTGHMIAQYRNLINDFGLTPVAQGKVKPMSAESPANRFAGRGKPAA